MLVDYVRVYQRSDGKIGCDPADRPTAAYIAAHANAYNNPNLTTWEAAGYTMPVSGLLSFTVSILHFAAWASKPFAGAFMLAACKA